MFHSILSEIPRRMLLVFSARILTSKCPTHLFTVFRRSTMRSTIRSSVPSSCLHNYRSRRLISRHPVALIALLLTGAAVFVFVRSSSAAGGDIDPAFNAGGVGANNTVFAVAVQSDGKIVVGGSLTSYNGDATVSDDVVRLNADGSLDTTFNASGAGADGTVRAVAVQPDAKIVIGGF